MSEEIVKVVNARLNNILLVAESSLSQSQFRAFRTLVLNEFGKSGLCRDLERILGNRPRQEWKG